MRYRLHFKSTPVGRTDSSGTHYITSEYPPGENVVEWEILNNVVADAFVYSTRLVLNNTSSSDISPDRWIAWNQYGKHLTWDSWKRDCDLLNAELDYCAELGYVPFDDSYRVSIDQTNEERLEKLNAIHFAFEKELENHKVQLTATEDFLKSLERLNRLVHSLEKSPNSLFGETFYVIRHSSDHVRSMYPKLTDEMYELFANNTMNGDIFSDFFTVGKDLGHAYHTNDVALVQNREVKPQSVVSAAVAFGLDRSQFKTAYQTKDTCPTYTSYYAWCELNGVRDYGYEYTEPQYNLGRAPVGKLLDHDYASLTETLQATPYVSRVELID